MGGDGQALCNKRRFLVSHGRGMHKAAGGGVDGGAASGGAGSALAAARKRIRDEGGNGSVVTAPSTIEWHSIPVDQQVGRCRASLETLPSLLLPNHSSTPNNTQPPPTPVAAAAAVVVADHAGYVYSATALVDFLLARATAKKSAPPPPAVVEASTTTSSAPQQQQLQAAAADPLSHIRKFKRDVFGLVPVGQNGGTTDAPNPFDGKIPQTNRSICVVPKNAGDGAGAEGGSRSGYVVGEDILREHWLHEINSQLKSMKTVAQSTSHESCPTTTTTEGPTASSETAEIVLSVPHPTSGGGKVGGEVVFTVSQSVAQYLRSWILNRPLVTTFDHSILFPSTTDGTTAIDASSTVPMATRLKHHAVLSEAVTGAVAKCFQTASQSSSVVVADLITAQLGELAKSIVDIKTSSGTATTSSSSSSSSSSGVRLPWFTELRLVAALTQPSKGHNGYMVELFPRSYTEATLSLAISHHE